MDVLVKLVIFRHPEYPAWDRYCSYCPELQYFFGRGNTQEECIRKTKDNLLRELEDRFYFKNLWIRHWKMTEDSIIPPTFTDEEAVKLTEKSYELSITEYQIEIINVKVPEVVRRRNLPGFYTCPPDVSL